MLVAKVNQTNMFFNLKPCSELKKKNLHSDYIKKHSQYFKVVNRPILSTSLTFSSCSGMYGRGQTLSSL